MLGLLPALMVILKVSRCLMVQLKPQFLEAGQEVKNLNSPVLKRQFAMLWLCDKDHDLRIT